MYVVANQKDNNKRPSNASVSGLINITTQRRSPSHLTIIELTMWPYVWPCVWQPTPRTADVTVTKIAGYVRVRILMNR